MLRTEADRIAIDRQRAIAEIDPEITDYWHQHNDLDKADFLAAAIVECHCQIACTEDPEFKAAIEWEISELSKAHEFFRVAAGQSPVEGQLALEVAS
ncbi:MAG: hypothetical protein ACRCZF_14825 [Gemmataceae bacterium]